jgi:polyhydroxyalkanoate synthesis regulator protein
VPGYLEFSLDNLMKDQEKYRKQMMDAAGVGEAFKGMEDQAKKNMALFNDAMKMFNPFAAMMNGAAPGSAESTQENKKPASSASASKDDLDALKNQLAAMQHKLDNITR